jgi:hypothetical protein
VVHVDSIDLARERKLVEDLLELLASELAEILGGHWTLAERGTLRCGVLGAPSSDLLRMS